MRPMSFDISDAGYEVKLDDYDSFHEFNSCVASSKLNPHPSRLYLCLCLAAALPEVPVVASCCMHALLPGTLQAKCKCRAN